MLRLFRAMRLVCLISTFGSLIFFAISLQIFLVIIIISLFCRRFSIAFPIIISVQVDLIQQLLLIIIV